MQMYKGLPIITNKIPETERNGIPHHLLDVIELKEKPWTVQHFVKDSSRIIDEIRARAKLPIVVGGTIYYTFSLLFKDAILSPSDIEVSNGSNPAHIEELERDYPMLTASTMEMFAKLKEIDPEMAKRWHPNDRLKIRNSLSVYLRSGRRASEIYAEQRRKSHEAEDSEVDPRSALTLDTGNNNGRQMSLRCPSLLLWLEAEDAILKARLNERVDTMVVDGLCDEVVQMARLEEDLKIGRKAVDLTSGIWTSIGYKEMKPWLELQQGLDNPAAKAATLRQDGIEAVKSSTRRYAKRQNRFVRIRLANALKAAVSSDLLFLLDCTDLNQWSSTVGEPAEALVTAFLKGDGLPEGKTLSVMAAAVLSQIDDGVASGDREARTCEVCNKTLMTEKEWECHLVSRIHKNLVARQRRLDTKLNEKFPAQTVQLPSPPD